jgi:hypothetical protein
MTLTEADGLPYAYKWMYAHKKPCWIQSQTSKQENCFTIWLDGHRGTHAHGVKNGFTDVTQISSTTTNNPKHNFLKHIQSL